MKQFPLVTIVTPAYNQAEYLAETIESVLAQDYPNIEYIVLDDGSTDSTPEVLQRYEGRAHVERHANMGQAATLNKGWANAKGEFLAYLSSDDRLLPNAVSRLVAALLAAPSAAVVYCDFYLIDAEGRRLREARAEDFDPERLVVDLVCQPAVGAVFRREVFRREGGWNESLRQVPDFEFWLRARRQGDFLRVPELLSEYRVHEGSASFRPMPSERAEEIVRVMENYWADAPGALASRSISNANLIAAKHHFQSGRFRAGVRSIGRAIRLHPATLARPAAWRSLLSGLLRRLYYRASGSVSR